MVESLGGEPGVNSARYAGEAKRSEDNISLLLKKLEEKNNRKARFVTIVTLVLNDEIHQFRGEIKGHISKVRKGRNGFGYDPVFIPEGWNKTFAEAEAAMRAVVTQSEAIKTEERKTRFVSKASY